MTFTKIGVNLDNLNNINPINLSLNTTKEKLVQELGTRINNYTNGYWGLIASTAVFAFLFWLFSDISEFGDFRYTKMRALGISACIVSIVGMICLNYGYFINLAHIVIFMGIAILSTIWVWKEEPQ